MSICQNRRLAQLWRFGVHLVLLVALGLMFALPLVDHHAAERDPGHRHLVFGGTARQRATAIGAHSHDYELPHHHDPLTGWPLDDHTQPTFDTPRVVAVLTQADLDALTIGLAAKSIVVPLLFSLPVLLFWASLLPRPHQPAWALTLPVTDPPPRLA